MAGKKRAAGGGRPTPGKRTPKSPAARSKATRPARSPRPVAEPAAPALPTEPFRLGAIPGATPGTWIDTWRTRYPATPIELVPLEVATQLDALRDGSVDAALVRLPIERDGLHVIALYDEQPVVVVEAESHLAAAETLAVTDLEGEVLIVPGDDVLGARAAGTRSPDFDTIDSTRDAIATVAAGVGIVIVPMSLARTHHRKDVTHRVLTDGPVSTVALAWRAEATTPTIDAFVGVVRGRTAASSRG